MVIEILSNLVSMLLYIVPILYFLPFKLRHFQKAILFLLIFFNILLIKYLSGNIGAILLLFTVYITDPLRTAVKYMYRRWILPVLCRFR